LRVTDEPIGGKDGKRSFLGVTDEAENTIVIDGTMPPTRQEEVLLHELVHLSDMTVPEQVVRTIASNLYGILRQNGLLVTDMVGKLSAGAVGKEGMQRLNAQSNEFAAATAHRVSEAAWLPDTTSCIAADLTILHWSDDSGQHDLLPVRQSDGALNRNAVYEAACLLSGARGGVTAPLVAKRKAARQLCDIYRYDLGESAPAVILALARSV
jgi:hypothetical protein